MPRSPSFDTQLAGEITAELLRSYSSSDIADLFAKSYDVASIRTNRDVRDCLESFLWEAFQLECESSTAMARVAAAHVEFDAFAAALRKLATDSLLASIRADLGRQRQPAGRAPERRATTSKRHLDPDTILSAIRQSGSRSSGAARLGDLKRLLGDPPQDEFAAALLSLQDLGHVVLYRNDNPQDITPEDQAATIYVGGSAPRHLVYLL
jgi:hypothetical protein